MSEEKKLQEAENAMDNLKKNEMTSNEKESTKGGGVVDFFGYNSDTGEFDKEKFDNQVLSWGS
jgi:hypothetical protein